MKAKMESILTPLNRSFACRKFEQEVFDHPFHYHPEIELTYISQSRGTRLVGDSMEPFLEGDLCLLGENLPHIYRNRRGTTSAAAEVVHFQRDVANSFFDTVVEMEAVSTLLDRSSVGLAFSEATGAQVGPMMEHLRVAEGAARWSVLLEILSILANASDTRNLTSMGYISTVDPEATDRMHRVCQYILDHFSEELSHKEMARMCHMSPAHFSRTFKSATRMTFTAFVTELRLGHVCRLLEETDWTVAEIAFQSGFGNLANFNRRFQAKYQQTPRQYRNRLHQSE